MENKAPHILTGAEAWEVALTIAREARCLQAKKERMVFAMRLYQQPVLIEMITDLNIYVKLIAVTSSVNFEREEAVRGEFLACYEDLLAQRREVANG